MSVGQGCQYGGCILRVILLISLSCLSVRSEAALFDELTVYEQPDVTEVNVRFTQTVMYQRHVPLRYGSVIQVYFTPLQPLAEDWIDDLPRVLPADGQRPKVTVTQISRLQNGTYILTLELGRDAFFEFHQGTDQYTMQLRLLHAQPVATPAVPVLAQTDSTPTVAAGNEAVERRAMALMQQAQQAIQKSDWAGSVEALNSLLNLPPNKQSEQAQELIGAMREKLGEPRKALIEYQLFIKLYPDSARRTVIEARIKALTQPVATVRSSKTTERNEWFGSILQTAYVGNSRIDTETLDTLSNTIDKTSLTTQDEQQLLSGVDVTYRQRNSTREQKWVLRDNYIANFLDRSDSRNRLYAAYWDYRHVQPGWGARVGRQNSQIGGILGRFDGMQAFYEWNKNLRFGLFGGQVADQTVNDKPIFYGAYTEQKLLQQRLNNQFYLVDSRTHGMVTRQAVGDVASWFGRDFNIFTMLDYDLVFAELNIAMLQGNWQYVEGGYVTWLVDRRRTPSLDLNNALIGEVDLSLTAAEAALGEAALRQQALERTAIADSASIAVTYPLTKSWQVGIDVRRYAIGALPASGSLPASPGTGGIITSGAQLIGNDWWWQHDAHVFSVSHIKSDTFDGDQYAYQMLLPLRRLSIEPSVRYYTQADVRDTSLSRWTTQLRLRWKIKTRMTIEMQYDGELSTTKTVTTEDRFNRTLWSAGYFWEF